jgi:hypothetical protein
VPLDCVTNAVVLQTKGTRSASRVADAGRPSTGHARWGWVRDRRADAALAASFLVAVLLRVSVLPTQRAHAAVDGHRATGALVQPALADPLTLPATYTAPSAPAKAPRQGEGAFERDGREPASPASDVRVKHDAAVVTVMRAALMSATSALVGAGDRVDALEQLAGELAPGLDRPHWLILGSAVDARAAIQLGLGQVFGKVDRVAHEAMATEARGSRLLRLEHACPRLSLREWGRAPWPATR